MAGVRKKIKKKHKKSSNKTWMAVGFDLSMSSVAGAAVAYDGTLRKILGPEFTMTRWERNTHYFDRILTCARAEDFIHELQVCLNVVAELDEIYIAVEEPWPMGMAQKMQSVSLKQSAEISGAFMSGLLRYGYKNIFQIHNVRWREVVAKDLGITVHYSKWNKFKPKEWALNGNLEKYPNIIPDWPDIIEHSKRGKIPRPEGSKAKAIQPDDRYDALAMMEWMAREIRT